MKTTRRAKAFLSIVLVITMLMSVAALGLVSASAANSLALTYSFKYQNAGYAEGRIRLSAQSSADYGNYYLYWADDTKALDGYAEITTLNLNQSSKSYALDAFTAIPVDATKLIAIKSDTAPTTKTVAAAAAVYDIPESKQFKYASSDMEYNFQALSDIHIQHDDSYWIYSKQHFANALEVAAKRDAEFITVCGDAVNGYSQSNLEKEWPIYLRLIADSSFTNPVYETSGNHEVKGNGGSTATQADINLYKIASGLDVDTEAMQSAPYYEFTGPSGDHYIFMVLELSGSPNESSEFTKAQLDWFEGLLEKYYGDGNKIIVNQHALIRGYGAGDNKETPYYGGALVDTYAEVQRLKSIMEKYPDIIMLSGHSHIDFKYKYNIDNMDGTTCYTVHIPSTSSTTHPNSSGTTDYIMSPDSSQGYFIDMYEDAVILNGTDLVKNEILPAYTYMIDYSGEELVESDDDIGGDTYEKVDVTVDVSNLRENAASVKISLYGADDDTLTETVTMTKNADGTFSGKASTEFTKMKFIVNDGTNDIKTKEYTVANCKVVLGAMKIEYDNPSNWSLVNVYVWNSVGGDAVSWPGMAMQKDAATGKYVATVTDDNNMIIFNNKVGDSGSQTDDLAIADYLVETIEGSYTVIGADPNPTDPEPTTAPTDPNPTTAPTEPSSTAPTEPSSTDPTEPEPSSTAPTEPEPSTTAPTEPATPDEYLYGDADLDGKVTVKDATTVQKHAADMITLEGKAFTQGNVSGDKAVNVRDATYIQKQVAGLITEFPVESKAELAAVGASSTELTTLLSNVKKTLSDESYYASYDAYMALKKAYYNYKDKTVSGAEINTAYAEINTALTDYNTMKKNNPSHVGAAAPIVKPEDGTYLIRGTMNNWDESGVMTEDGNGVSITYNLAAGTHSLKVYEAASSKWYGNGGTFTDSCSGWTMTDGAGNLTFTATGGTYKFYVAIEASSGKVKLTVTKL